MKVDLKAYKIINNVSGETVLFEPKAIESCMNPGKFNVTPVSVSEDEEVMTFLVEDKSLIVEKYKIKQGEVSIVEMEFTPQVSRRKGNCRPCTNCGRC